MSTIVSASRLHCGIRTMLVASVLWLFLIKSAASATVHELYERYLREGETLFDDYRRLMNNDIPGYSPELERSIIKEQKEGTLPEVKHKKMDYRYYAFYRKYASGAMENGITFNIYDDKSRETINTVFNLLKNLDDEDYNKFMRWGLQYINKDMMAYIEKIATLYINSSKNKKEFIPCYISKPNYFVNSETIVKALRMRDFNNDSILFQEEMDNNQIYTSKGFVVINSNYSGWNLLENGGDEELNYFREDSSLNCYYAGVHLLHPFWMSNENLDHKNPRHAEHYYYSHQQLMARYQLEKEHLQQKNQSVSTVGESPYNPYLIYDNGLHFPIRPAVNKEWNEDRAKLRSIDIAIRECIARGTVIMGNGTKINMTDETHIDFLAKLIRANLDGTKIAKTIRSLYGYGGSDKHLSNQYNPAPSVLHHPETSLRDPLYWNIIQYVLDYFMEYKESMEPFDISQYEADDIVITNFDHSKLSTFFEYFGFHINNALGDKKESKWRPIITVARQRKLAHQPFVFNFTVESLSKKDVVVRIFLGPNCEENCWNKYSKFFELDTFKYKLQEGSNNISWSPSDINKFSFDDYDIVFDFPDNYFQSSYVNRFNMFKFPENLLIPQGLEEGLNMTVFIMITPIDSFSQAQISPESNYYKQVCNEVDTKPLGFPFHRQARSFKDEHTNFKFYDILIYHEKKQGDIGYFSPNLF